LGSTIRKLPVEIPVHGLLNRTSLEELLVWALFFHSICSTTCPGMWCHKSFMKLREPEDISRWDRNLPGQVGNVLKQQLLLPPLW